MTGRTPGKGGTKMKTALVVLAEGFETIEALTPVDVLRRLGVKVTVAGLGGLEITSAHKVTVKADALLAPALAPVDAIVLPGLNFVDMIFILQCVSWSL